MKTIEAPSVCEKRLDFFVEFNIQFVNRVSRSGNRHAFMYFGVLALFESYKMLIIANNFRFLAHGLDF